MSFRYVNPGYIELLSEGVADVQTVESEIYNPTNRVALKISNTGAVVSLPKAERDLYLKFDFYKTGSSVSFGIGYGNYYESVYGLKGNSSDINISISSITSCYIKLSDSNKLYKVWCHFHIGEDYTTSYGELMVNDTKVTYQFTSRNFSSYSNANVSGKNYCISHTGSDYVSNIIISDEYVSPKEEVIILPTLQVETNMKENEDGTYTANDEGQMLLQKINAQELIENYGGKSKVTSMSAISIPAKATNAMRNMVAIDDIEGVMKEHDTILASSTSDTVGVYDCWKLNKTLADLEGKSVGWKVFA